MEQEKWERWRLSENTGDGSPFKWRVIGGGGRESRPVALFMHLTDVENALNDHRFAAIAREALEKIADMGNLDRFYWREKWGDTIPSPSSIAVEALRSLTEGDQAAGEEKKGSGE